MRRLLFSALVSVVVAGAGIGGANAAIERLENVTNASSICSGVRSSDNAQLRSSALMLANVGSKSAFVNCSFVTLMDQDNGGNVGLTPVRYFGAFFTNSGNAAATVKCTSAVGYANNAGGNTYESMEVSVPPDDSPESGSGYIFFGDQPGVMIYQNVSMTCVLPVGVGIADTYLGFSMDDANGAV
jgi:hypothetical protein